MDERKLQSTRRKYQRIMKTILKEAGLSGLTAKQWILLIWFGLSLMGLTIDDDAPALAWLIVFANVAISGYLCRKIKIKPIEN